MSRAKVEDTQTIAVQNDDAIQKKRRGGHPLFIREIENQIYIILHKSQMSSRNMAKQLIRSKRDVAYTLLPIFHINRK